MKHFNLHALFRPFWFLNLGAVWAIPLILFAGDPALIDIRTKAPGIRIDIRYATANNFTGQPLYPVGECLLCEPVAERLAAVQKQLEKKGLGLKVWDCYRPLSIQQKLWEIVPDPRYVADPKTGSRHNRGASVDLTLVDKNGNELPMPTPYDEFSSRAHRDYRDVAPHIIKNRALLEEAMSAQGFIGLPTEWWHFDAPEWSQFALRDEPLGSASLKTDIPAVSQAGSVLNALSHALQLLVVTSDNWSSPKGRLRRYEKQGDRWNEVGTAWSISLGSKGMSWGRGLHSAASNGPQKKEGDQTSPAGLFKIGSSYGYAPQPPAGSSWPYQPVDKNWLCIDDPKSTSYNRVLSTAQTDQDWASAEQMHRTDHLYKWVINIEQNYPDVTAGCGSCIFLHVWRKPQSPTEGCTAMAEEHMIQLLQWLNPLAQPLLVQLPQDGHLSLKELWGLP